MGVFWVFFIEGGAFWWAIISFLFTHYKVVYEFIDDNDYKSTLFWLILWAKGKAMVVKRGFFETP